MWCLSEHPFIENQSNDTILVTNKWPDKVQIQTVKVLFCLHIHKTDYSGSGPPCTSGNNWPLIYKTFRSILFWWWKLSSFSAPNTICYLYSSCEHYDILLRKGDSSICITRNEGKKDKYWKINWHAQSCWQLQRMLTLRHPVHCALAIQATLRVARYIGDFTLIIQKEGKKAL